MASARSPIRRWLAWNTQRDAACPAVLRKSSVRSELDDILAETEAHPFARELGRVANAVPELTRTRLERGQVLVGMQRIVVEEHEPPRAGGAGERDGVSDARVPPTAPRRVLLLGVLRVVDEK